MDELFDYEYYLDKYSDLKNIGIQSEEEAIDHWNNYGKNENRCGYGKICGFAVSTYHRNYNRIEVFKTCISSIMKYKEKETIVIIVDDGSNINDHIIWVKTTFPDITVIEKKENGGIAKCKNTCLRALNEANCDNFFLLDDDIEFLKSIEYKYTQSLCEKKVGILCGRCLDNKVIQRYSENTNITNIVNGFLLCFTRYNFKKAGYFKIFPHKYGHEHTWYTYRIMTCMEQHHFLDINCNELYYRLSNIQSSMSEEDRLYQLKENEQKLNSYSCNYEECIE
jgi:glycosyltransferase involved in cell wall biosynthesis